MLVFERFLNVPTIGCWVGDGNIYENRFRREIVTYVIRM